MNARAPSTAEQALRLYTVQCEEFGVFVRYLWKARDGALAWLKSYRKPSEKEFSNWLARTNGTSGYYYIAAVPVLDVSDIDGLPDELFVMVDWISGSSEDPLCAPRSARMFRDDVHCEAWKVLP